MEYQCYKCGSRNLKPFHYIAYGDYVGVQIHYKFECLDCGKTTGVEKNKNSHPIFKGTGWVRSKNAKKHQDKIEEYFENRRKDAERL